MVQSFSTMTADYTISSRQRSGGSGTVRIRNSGEGVATIEGSEGGHDDGQRRLSFLDDQCTHGRVIVTHDDDFLTLAASGSEHGGICYCHQQKHTVGKLIQMLLVVHSCCTKREMQGHVEFL